MKTKEKKDHKNLHNKFDVWITQIKDNNIMDATEYENSLKKIIDFSDWETFWKIYQHLKRPSELPLNFELFFFRENIKPVWENKFNRGGGKYIIKAKLEFGDLVWEKILIEFLASNNENCCGIVMTRKRNDIVIALWIKEIEIHQDKLNIKKWIRNVFNLEELYIYFKEHPLTEDITHLREDWDNLLKIAKTDTFNNL